MRSLLSGGLPLNAMDRLQEQASRQGTPAHLFSSDLSASELMLTAECGFVPLGQVMGSSVYNVGYQYMPTNSWWTASGELETITRAHYEARGLTFSRLRQEAKLLKADGVVGVRFYMREIEGGMLEYIAIGTAVRRTDAPPIGPDHEPFVSNLSGQDHWMLRKDGYRPVGFCFGNCTWFQFADWRSQSAMGGWWNSELTSVTSGLYAARELAMDRVEIEARAVGAEGVVGMKIETHFERYESSNDNAPAGFIFHFTAFGTAVAPENSPSQVKIFPVLSLKDPELI
jgi:uncharacterized protein YbjQ (UPF0145 family)